MYNWSFLKIVSSKEYLLGGENNFPFSNVGVDI